MTFIQYLLYVKDMDGYATLVGNSLVRNWDREGKGPIRIKCLPGATLNTIINNAEDFRCVNQIVLFLQSGIPDLHVKGVADIDEDKLDVYKLCSSSESECCFTTSSGYSDYLPSIWFLRIHTQCIFRP